MKTHVETASAARIRVSVLAASGAVVSSLEFNTMRVLLAWLAQWGVELIDGDHLVARWIGYQSPLREFLGHTREDGALRLNVFVGAAHIDGLEVFDLLKARPRGARPPAPYRDGPVKGTGKHGTYRYYRRHLRTFGEHREGVYPDDECEVTPSTRACRNRANLPSARDGRPRCVDFSWKAHRNHQWKGTT
jgi:hypothetical protein